MSIPNIPNPDSDVPRPDPFEQAVNAMNEARIPSPPDAEFNAKLVRLMQADEHQITLGWSQKLLKGAIKMKFSTKCMVVAAAALFVMFGSLIFRGGNSIALADVLAALENIRSATWTITTEIETPQGKTISRGTGISLSPGRERIETMVNNVTTTTITDYVAGKSLTLEAQSKKAISITFPAGKPDQNPGNKIEGFRQMIAAESRSTLNARDLGTKTFGDQKAIGFEFAMSVGVIQIWADSQNGLPVRIEMDAPATSKLHEILSDIKVNPPIDESLLELKIPEGYTEQKLGFTGTADPESMLIKLLEIIAKHNGSRFPDELLGESGINSYISKLVKAIDEAHEPGSEASNQAKIQLAGTAAGAIAFASSLPKESLDYWGENVLLGAKETPILRFQHAGKSRVIYADLTVKDE